MTIRTQADIAELEKMPVTERIRHGNMLELMRQAAPSMPTGSRSASSPARRRPIRCATSRFDELLQRVIQTANLLARRGHRPERHRDDPDAQRAGDLLRAVGRGDRRGRQSGELLPQRLADRRHHEGGRRQGADRRRSVAVRRHLAEGRGDPRGDAGAQGVPRRRQRPRARRRDRLRGGHRRATRRQARSRPRRSRATRWRRCSTPAARPACRSSRATPMARWRWPPGATR